MKDVIVHGLFDRLVTICIFEVREDEKIRQENLWNSSLGNGVNGSELILVVRNELITFYWEPVELIIIRK